jgi:hypothetical protein
MYDISFRIREEEQEEKEYYNISAYPLITLDI